MTVSIPTGFKIALLGAAFAMSGPVCAQTSSQSHDHNKEHTHEDPHEDTYEQAGATGHSHEVRHEESHDHGDAQIYRGYFEDHQIKDRALSDWGGDWQSLFPYLASGALDVVMAHKAEKGDKTAQEYLAYYDIGYATDVDRIVISGDSVSFYRGGVPVRGRYEADGFEVLTYAKGNRGVRFVFEKTAGDEAAPAYIQFSDHRIFPSKADHFHLYWGNDRAKLLEELTNWPTYFPMALSGAQIVEEMLAH